MDATTKAKIESAIAGINSLEKKGIIEDQQLDDAIEIEKIVLEYLEKRIGNSLLLLGFITELHQFERMRERRKENC